MGYVTWPRPFQGRFVIRRLGFAMFNPHIKFEMCTITCNEAITGNAKCKNSRFEPPFGVLGPLVLIELFRQLSRLRRYEHIGRNCAV